MPMWRNNDVASNSVIWAPAYVNKAPTRANANTLFGNSTAGGYITNLTTGVFGVDRNELKARRAAGSHRPAHTGWVLKKTKGTRVQYEVLVALKNMSSDAENTAFPNYALIVLSNPANATVNASSNSNTANFSMTANSVPAGANLSYYWQLWNGSAFVNCTANATFANVTNTVLVVSANTLTGNAILRGVVASANGVVSNNIPTTNAYLTRTT